ncbi:MAG: DUF1961 family protein [Spirochaetales bacterium]|nr:DUF1961 family protein [Spirochaetales bacterium]
MKSKIISDPITYKLPETDGIKIHGSTARIIEVDGRSGLNLTGIRGRVELTQHTVGLDKGSMTLWICPLQHLHGAREQPEHSKSNELFGNYTIISDREALREITKANFAICWQAAGAPKSFWAKFAQGSFVKIFNASRQGAMLTTNDMQMEELCWYQITATWDRPASKYKLYVNGILVGTSDNSAKKLFDDPCGPFLYLGNPAIAYSDISFYDKVLNQEEISSVFKNENKKDNPELQNHLEQKHAGIGHPNFDWTPDSMWKKSLELPLNSVSDLQQFFIQGYGNGVEVCEEGFHITTPSMEEANSTTGIGQFWTDNPSNPVVDMTRMYMWTRQVFEGDLHFSMEIKLLERGGLSLLLLQAAGMQGEDFMDEYFLRTNGSMVTVYGEDVRSYAWEYYRDMVDVRNDKACHCLTKNPWYKPLDAQTEDRVWDLNRWYKIEFLQEGRRLRCVVDGVTVMDTEDSSYTGQGPVLHNGHIALRFMMRTNVMIRNLCVRNKELFNTRPLISD